MRSYLSLILISIFFNAPSAFGFLENSTHGYSNCLTCHYSPAGGDMLNEYGRSLSSELMSTWSAEGFEKSFGGLVNESKWAKFGGDLRSMQSYLDTPQREDRSLFVMQNNVEIGLKYKKLMFIGNLGTREGPSATAGKSDFLSERHYVLAELSPTSRLRVGKFRINFGLNDPNHFRLIKRNLGFGSNTEKYNLEYTKYFDNWDITANYSVGRADLTRSSNDERSFSTKASHYLGGKSKIGLSYLYGETPDSSRSIVGAFGVTPITEKSYVVYEFDYENESQAGVSTERLLTHTRVGYEFFKGFKAYGMYDLQRNYDNSGENLKAPGLGFQWLPIAHLEMQVEYQKLDFEAATAGSSHFGFVMAHIYY